MTTFLEQAELARSDDFRVRVQQAIVKASVAIGAEELPDYRRASYSTQVLNNPDYYAQKFVFGVASNATITAESTDNDIEFTVNSMFNAYAGAYDKTEPVASPAITAETPVVGTFAASEAPAKKRKLFG